MTERIGRSIRPLDWQDRSLGRVDYVNDLTEPPHLHAAVLRSPVPYGRITRLDAAPALRMPGVRGVITADDFPSGITYLHRGGHMSDRPPLAAGVVRYVGQEIAAVAADTVEQARAAVAAIRLRIRPLRAPLTIAEALAPRSRSLHERPSERNVAIRWNSVWGDPDAGIAASDVMVEGDFVYPSVAHACMEPNVTLARWDADREVMELWTSTHAPYFIAKEVSHLLGLEHHQVVCREVATGGSFGSKSKASEHEILAAALARKTATPVLISLTREEEFASNKPRHRFETRLRTYADADGNLRAFETELNVDNGAYSHMGSSVMRVGVIALGSVYRADGVRYDARLVDTATQPGGQYRGYGTPQVALAMESQLDEIAERLGMDPIDLRVRNAVEPDTETLCGYRLTTARLVDCLETVRRELDWDAKRAARTYGRGVGVSSAAHGSGAYAYPLSNVSEAGVDVDADGRVRVRFGGSDAGTGQKTILAQIAAEELGVAPEDVDVLSMDGELTPLDLGAWSSRATHMSGTATGRAAREMAHRLRGLAADKLGCAPGDVELRDGAAVHGDHAMSFGDLAGAHGGLSLESRYELEGTETITPGEDRANLSPTYSFAAHGAEVEVDVRTGKVTVLDYVAAHDVGRAINPVMVEGQIIGGAVHGIGAALGEELIRTEGRVVNPAYINYALPRAADVPRVRPFIVEGHDDAGPYGAKSVGEIPIVPPGAAIANAVHDAVGVRIRDLPITPDKVLRALAEKEGRVRDHRLRRRPSRWWIALMRAAYPRGVHALLHRWGTHLGRQGRYPGLAPAVPDIAEIVRPESLAEAGAALRGGTAIGGGTDVLLQRRQRLAAPERLVSTALLPGLRDITEEPDGTAVIGAAVTLAELSARFAESIPALAEVADSIASPQVRNAATVAGNLLQAKRCWFFRNDFPCYKRNGASSPCYAILGDHRFYHAAVDGHRCQAVTPSDLATVLAALDAVVELSDGRRIPIGDLYTGPGETALKQTDLVVAVRIPEPGRPCVFEKLALWQGDFAVVSVAASSRSAERWDDCRIVFGALAPTPWRPADAERALDGRPFDPAALRDVVDAELTRHGHPLPGNAWKLDAAAGLAERAAERLTHDREETV
ncbi:CO/xanthine dehydrogenase Mo-binding subunit/CO/xanthine dehydrogenase FAD-binding subunit [Actinomadura luteofluorescens]|uniref:CO/xanthine dehydrogenase Mo-binding subunit/CO/xanthine dehydrogenase FAD-binding subunit n=1 Tax=Actinomadura luteofluorescens TaxID=46163 RepID=A0A7Y9EBR6_9ACTN|nr:molybdopterin cofactor-binding domain-containing protein [Actinomadura luteofluorescens]NYD44831.1 CO/xanthine dehydrogenase Mo-binding subunit/CO/xanthine dehydrogenase FAD-binding subunit [Actinomadura luteofluorescens]